MNVFRVASYSISGDYALIVSMEPERTQMFDSNGYFLRKPNELRVVDIEEPGHDIYIAIALLASRRE